MGRVRFMLASGRAIIHPFLAAPNERALLSDYNYDIDGFNRLDNGVMNQLMRYLS